MKFRTSILVPVMMLLMACQFTVPLSTAHNIAIDPDLLGNWKMLADADDPGASLDTVTIMQFSDSEYLVRYFSEGSNMYFRAYLIDPGGERLLQMVLLGSDEGPWTQQDDEHRYVVARLSLEANTLSVSTLNTNLVSRDTNDTETLLAAYLENKENPELFTNPGRFEKL